MSIFDQLRRSKTISGYNEPVARKGSTEFFFCMKPDTQGIYLEAVDKAGKQTTFDYRQHSGTIRNIARSVQLINDRNNFTVDWENPESRLYLHHHPYLVPQLLASGILVSEDKDLITAGTGTTQLQLVLTPKKNDTLTAQITLTVKDQSYTGFTFITDEYIWVPDENLVFETEPVGPLFYSLHQFNVAALPQADVQKYLSLFFSYVTEIGLQYGNYGVKRETEPIRSKPALIFEKVDADNSLYMRIGQILPNTGVDFLDEYDLSNFATLNEMEETIVVRPLEQLTVEQHVNHIEKLLLKHADKAKRKTESGIIRDEMLLIIPQDIASEFIYQDIPSLIGEYTLIGSEKLREYKINVNPPRLNVQLGHGIDFLEGSATLEFGSQQISLFDAINQYNKHRYVVLSDGSHALVNEQYMQKLQRLFKKKRDKVEISFFDLPLVEELIEERTANEQFGMAKGIFEGFNKIAETKLKLPAVNATLRPYQQQGFKWLNYLYTNKLGGCLADDMGLGKTLQTITLLAHIYGREKEAASSIIVMPKTLLFNWEAELKKFAPQLTHYTWYAGTRNMEDALKANIILTTYAMLRNDIEEWKEVDFLYAILDESQTAKNLQSQVHKAVMLLQAQHRLALSGTPVENNLSELYALFRFLNPAMFGSSDSFNQNYLTPIQKHDDKDATVELRRKIYPFILRRLKKDVLSELPDKIEQTLYVEMNPEQARYYESRRLYYKQAIEQQVASKGIQQSQFFIFQAMNELRQIASIPEAQTDGRIQSPKAELLMEQLDDALANRHKVLVFANYLAAVEHIGEELDKRGIDFVTMTGSTRNRQQLVDKFQNDADCRVFVLTLKTGGTGLNLTAADMVFIFDPWWNKAAENQAIDRAHRIGQQKKVLSYKLITLNTIEEKILQLQETKSALFDNIISSDNASLKSLTEDDIEFMLGK